MEGPLNRAHVRSRSTRAALVGAVAAIGVLFAPGAAAAQVTLPPNFQSTVFASGGTALTNPDDITMMDGVIYVVYQNGTAPDGSTGGNSTVVGYLPNGTQDGSWNIVGHVDGLTADHDRLIATVNEDANSSLATIRPEASPSRQLRLYTYSPDLTTVPGAGGTDAVSIVDGKILISGSNPSPTTTNGTTFAAPAVYAAKIPPRGSVVTLTPVFYDNSSATDAVSGQQANMNLSDPDSNATVPQQSLRFRGQFMLDSQGDSALIFDRHPGRPSQSLTILHLTSASGAPQVDDTRWSTSQTGTLYVVDAGADQIDAITGPFGWGTVITAIPSDSPAMAGQLGTVNLFTGVVSPFASGFTSPKGLLFVSSPNGHHGRGQGNDQGNHHGHGQGGQNGQGGQSGQGGQGQNNGNESGSHSHGHQHQH
jgi:hypothetical protein